MSESRQKDESLDLATAQAFAQSWNRISSVYTREQFLEWFAPLTPDDLQGRDVLELGFGNGSLLLHAARCKPSRLAGIDLGDTSEQAKRNLAGAPVEVELHQGDLIRAELGLFDVVYCIGVLHHLNSPAEGFDAVLRHVKPGGRFHCWVYAWEGNRAIRFIVEPVRRIASRMPWWLTKYGIALPLVVPYFVLVKCALALGLLGPESPLRRLPLFGYSRWIAPEPLRFFRHVAFDQLVTPQTAYLDRATIERWLADPRVDASSAYMVFRNGNSWKFGGRRKA